MATDEELLEHAASLPHLYFDGYVCYRKMNGVLRCIAHIDRVPQYNIITSLTGADQANRDTRRVLDGRSVRSVWAGKSATH